MGKLNLIIGPMFSGKTTQLIETYNKYIKRNDEKFNIIAINHKLDTRYTENSICSHDLIKIPCISLNKLSDYYSLYNNGYEVNNKVILIDEAQFFDDLFYFCLNIVDNTDTIIYVFGLFTKKLVNNNKNNNNDDDNEQISVGGSEKYIPVCRKCYLDKEEED